jgi:membrane protease YdiL (CAAX protease family)
MNWKRWVRSLSSDAEFAFVVLGGLSVWIFRALMSFAAFGGRGVHIVTPSMAVRLCAIELFQLTLIFGFLRVRGWQWRSLNLRVGWATTGLGLLLVPAASIVAWLALLISWFAAGPAALESGLRYRFEGGILAALLVSVINPVFEECVVTSYVVEWAAPRHGGFFAVILSAVLRATYHIYQGPVASVEILVIGMLFAWFYKRFRSLWSLILAHGILDLIGFVRDSP